MVFASPKFVSSVLASLVLASLKLVSLVFRLPEKSCAEDFGGVFFLLLQQVVVEGVAVCLAVAFQQHNHGLDGGSLKNHKIVEINQRADFAVVDDFVAQDGCACVAHPVVRYDVAEQSFFFEQVQRVAGKEIP